MATQNNSTETSSKAKSFQPPDKFTSSGPKKDNVGDDRAGDAYVFNERVRRAVRVALATGRPLLVRGASGWGKSSLAAASAKYLGWKLRDVVVTSRTQSRDLLWTVDLLKRLSDAQANKVDPDWRRYVKPGPLWWAFNPSEANAQAAFFARIDTPSPLEPEEQAGTVVLIDEIDKADPDVPNNLLVPLGSLEFEVEELSTKVVADQKRVPLVIITTNEERALPNAFLRRCVQVELPAFDAPDEKDEKRKQLLIDIAELRLQPKVTKAYIKRLAEVLFVPENPLPSPAEFLDAVRAAKELLEADPKADPIKEIASLVMQAPAG